MRPLESDTFLKSLKDVNVAQCILNSWQTWRNKLEKGEALMGHLVISLICRFITLSLITLISSHQVHLPGAATESDFPQTGIYIEVC